MGHFEQVTVTVTRYKKFVTTKALLVCVDYSIKYSRTLYPLYWSIILDPQNGPKAE